MVVEKWLRVSFVHSCAWVFIYVGVYICLYMFMFIGRWIKAMHVLMYIYRGIDKWIDRFIYGKKQENILKQA